MSITISLIFIILLFALIETPLFTIIAGLSAVCLYFTGFDPLSLQLIVIEMNRMASMPVLTALPLFTCVGCLLASTKAPERIMNFIQALLCWLPGGIAIAALFSCALFTALTGASGVT
ncbi:MAG: TRAP transporter large permease subunit, partial [Desulfobacterales bacterium]|nr:TRAP transporter large permease subunit [Deltaproteobacteria bacterium]NNL43235.1 TRAP transporter large permease subunit [Desulfobacterales bacterium]